MADASTPVLVVGLSGATWEVIDPLLARGELPNLAHLIDGGTRGVLQSVKTLGDRHFRSQTAWPSILTGRIPERHGISEWYHTHRNLHTTGIWDVFAAHGQRCGIYGTPVFWPPPRIEGFVVPAPHGRDAQAWPEDLSPIMGYFRHQQSSMLTGSRRANLARSLRFLPAHLRAVRDPALLWHLMSNGRRALTLRDREERALALGAAELDFNTAVFLRLHKTCANRGSLPRGQFPFRRQRMQDTGAPSLVGAPPADLLRRHTLGFSIFTSFHLDHVSHRYWRYREPERFPGTDPGAAAKFAGAVDDAYRQADNCLGSLLRRTGEPKIAAVVSEHGMAAETDSNEIGRWQYMIDGPKVHRLLGLDDDLVTVPIARWIAVRRRDGGPVDPTTEHLLREIRVVETRRALFSTYFHSQDEVVIKVNLQKGVAPEVDDIGTLTVTIPGHEPMPLSDLLVRVGPTRSAMHTAEGVLVLNGPGIREGAEVQGASIVDVMPTLLRAAGLPVPGDLDGAPLDVFTDAVRTTSRREMRPPRAPAPAPAPAPNRTGAVRVGST